MTDDALPMESNIIMYRSEDGTTRIEVRIEDETAWLSQAALVDLYQTTKQNISRHLGNIYREGELDRAATVKYCLTVRTEGSRRVRRRIEYYNLDAVLAVGYRVRSHRGTQFRRWATERLREYLVKGFTLDDERLKAGRNLAADYFDELLERIREIRASEKRFYLKVREIFATSADYDSESEISRTFSATVQNKLHWAIHGHTAAELIDERVDADAPNMGLTTWRGKVVRKADVTVAKNYLTEEELRGLNRIVTMYLDYAEDQAEQQQLMYMRDWVARMDAFLTFNGREVLQHAGTISAALARQKARDAYERFSARRLVEEAEESEADLDDTLTDMVD